MTEHRPVSCSCPTCWPPGKVEEPSPTCPHHGHGAEKLQQLAGNAERHALNCIARERQVRQELDEVRADFEEDVDRINELERANVELANQCIKYNRALYRISGMPTEPRPDGSFNYCREAIIDIAKRALEGSDG